MTADDVKTALDTLEAQDTDLGTGRGREVLKKGVALAQEKAVVVREVVGKASSAAEQGAVNSVKDAAALGRLVQDAILHDAYAALECVNQIAQARSPIDVARAQFDYVRSQTRTNVERWRSVAGVLGRAAQAATDVVEAGIQQRAR